MIKKIELIFNLGVVFKSVGLAFSWNLRSGPFRTQVGFGHAILKLEKVCGLFHHN